jgi:catechol 2,3-dioxygenase-like lactoylglutathione lyase family enzyme
LGARLGLEAAGVRFEDYSDPADAFFRDPDGNVFVLVNA